MTKLEATQLLIILNCYKKLLKSVETDNIEKIDLICKNIEYIKSLKPFMPLDIFDSFLNIINECIEPIVDNPEYTSQFLSPELGAINNEGIFEFISKREFTIFYARICENSIALENRIQEWAYEVLLPLFQ